MRSRLLWYITPFIGAVSFLTLYLVATFYYPGGSHDYPHAVGYSWVHNHWRNLLSETALNGEPNPARPLALTAMMMLALSLGTFWYNFPREAGFPMPYRTIFQVSGIGAMLISLFLVRDAMDPIMNVARLFGFTAILGATIGAWKLGWRYLSWMGVINLCIVLINFSISFVHQLQPIAPLFQKFSLLYHLCWLCFLNMGLYKKFDFLFWH